MTSPFIAPIIILQGKVLIDGFKSVCTVIQDDISVIKKRVKLFVFIGFSDRQKWQHPNSTIVFFSFKYYDNKGIPVL